MLGVMDFTCVPLAEAAAARGTAVVIDVLRAFTAAPAALASGAERLLLVAGVDEALALRDRIPGALAMGEVDGHMATGFDIGNSPIEATAADLAGCTIVHRSTAGTRGVVEAVEADRCFAASFAVAEATVAALRAADPADVTFVITGVHTDLDGDEDQACADYLMARLRGARPDVEPYLQRVRASTAGRRFGDPDQAQYPQDDLEFALVIDRYDFALPVHRDGAHPAILPPPAHARATRPSRLEIG